MASGGDGCIVSFCVSTSPLLYRVVQKELPISLEHLST